MKRGDIKTETESVTFRVSKNILESLRRESKQKRISLNTLTTQIFDQYVGWNSKAAVAGMVSLPKYLLTLIIENNTEEAVIEIAKKFANVGAKEIILMLRQQYNITSFVDVLEFWMKESAFPYIHEITSGKHKFTLQHDMGRKWSIYFGEAIQSISLTLNGRKTDFELTDNLLTFTIDTST